ncbi:MAG: hypothetical protein ACLTCV_12750 [Oscillospiraceae bacterium]
MRRAASSSAAAGPEARSAPVRRSHSPSGMPTPTAANAAGDPTPPSHKTPQHSAPPRSTRARSLRTTRAVTAGSSRAAVTLQPRFPVRPSAAAAAHTADSSGAP